MTTFNRRVVQLTQLVSVAAILALAPSAFAASTWSNLGSGCAATASSGLAVGNVLSCGTSSSVTLTADSFSTSNGATSTTGTVFASAALYNWGSGNGLGVVNKYEDPSATGPHAVDNQYGTDALRLNFTSAVSLTNVGLGWVGGDADFSVLAWTGTGTPTVTGTTLTGTAGTSTLLSSGWTLVANYGSNAGGGALSTVSSAIYSSYWLISAYNTSFGSTSADGGALNMASTYDAFKLLSVAGNTCSGTLSGTVCGTTTPGKVPEPGSLALMGIALTGFVAVRRRKQKQEVAA